MLIQNSTCTRHGVIIQTFPISKELASAARIPSSSPTYPLTTRFKFIVSPKNWPWNLHIRAVKVNFFFTRGARMQNMRGLPSARCRTRGHKKVFTFSQIYRFFIRRRVIPYRKNEPTCIKTPLYSHFIRLTLNFFTLHPFPHYPINLPNPPPPHPTVTILHKLPRNTVSEKV